MTRPEILFLSHRIPYPPDKGDKIRSWAWLKHLASRFRVHLACFVDDPRDFAHRDFLSSLCETAALVPLSPRWARVKSATALFKGDPLSFHYFSDRKMTNAVAAARVRPLAMEFAFSSAMAPFIEAPVEGRKRLVDFCDADSEKWRGYEKAARAPLAQIYGRESRLLAEAETRIANWADASFAVTPDETALFNDRSSISRPVSILSNGVDISHFDPQRAKTSDAFESDVVFIGAMNYRANAEGVLHFMQAVWPQIRQARPDARFVIVGPNPVSKISALHGKDGVTVTGRVDDVRPWLQGAKVVIAPLNVARGVQNKVLEAMAMAKPVVASAEAMTGINAPANAAVAATAPDAMAQEILSLLDSKERRDMVGAAARAFVIGNFSWDAATAQLDAALDRLGLYSSSSSAKSDDASSSISATR